MHTCTAQPDEDGLRRTAAESIPERQSSEAARVTSAQSPLLRPFPSLLHPPTGLTTRTLLTSPSALPCLSRLRGARWPYPSSPRALPQEGSARCSLPPLLQHRVHDSHYDGIARDVNAGAHAVEEPLDREADGGCEEDARREGHARLLYHEHEGRDARGGMGEAPTERRMEVIATRACRPASTEMPLTCAIQRTTHGRSKAPPSMLTVVPMGSTKRSTSSRPLALARLHRRG